MYHDHMLGPGSLPAALEALGEVLHSRDMHYELVAVGGSTPVPLTSSTSGCRSGSRRE